MIGQFWQQTNCRFGFSSSKYARKHTSDNFPMGFWGCQFFWSFLATLCTPFGSLWSKIMHFDPMIGSMSSTTYPSGLNNINWVGFCQKLPPTMTNGDWPSSSSAYHAWILAIWHLALGFSHLYFCSLQCWRSIQKQGDALEDAKEWNT